MSDIRYDVPVTVVKFNGDCQRQILHLVADCYTFSGCVGLLNGVIKPVLTYVLETLHKDEFMEFYFRLFVSQSTCINISN